MARVEPMVLFVAHAIEQMDRLHHTQEIVDCARRHGHHQASAAAHLGRTARGKRGLILIRDVLDHRESRDHVKRLAARHRAREGAVDIPVLGGARGHRVHVDADAAAQPVVEDSEQRAVGASDVQDARALYDIWHDAARSLPLKSVVKPLHRSWWRHPTMPAWCFCSDR